MSISTFSPCVHSLCLNHDKRAHRQPRDASCAARRRGRYISQSHARPGAGGRRDAGDRRQPTDADRERSKSPRPPADLVPPRARCACVNVCSISRMFYVQLGNPRYTNTFIAYDMPLCMHNTPIGAGLGRRLRLALATPPYNSQTRRARAAATRVGRHAWRRARRRAPARRSVRRRRLQRRRRG